MSTIILVFLVGYFLGYFLGSHSPEVSEYGDKLFSVLKTSLDNWLAKHTQRDGD